MKSGAMTVWSREHTQGLMGSFQHPKHHHTCPWTKARLRARDGYKASGLPFSEWESFMSLLS